jgi:hypothetical protein
LTVPVIADEDPGPTELSSEQPMTKIVKRQAKARRWIKALIGMVLRT